MCSECITLLRALLISICIISSSPVLSCARNTAQHASAQSQTSTPWTLPRDCQPKAPKESLPQRTCQLSNDPLHRPPARSGSHKQPTRAAWYMRRSSESNLMTSKHTNNPSVTLADCSSNSKCEWLDMELLHRCSRASSYCSGARVHACSCA